MQKESSSGYKLQANDVRIEKQMHSNGPFAFLTMRNFLAGHEVFMGKTSIE